MRPFALFALLFILAVGAPPPVHAVASAADQAATTATQAPAPAAPAPATTPMPAPTPQAATAVTTPTVQATPGLPPSMKIERAVVEAAVARVSPALVRIHVVESSYNDGRAQRNEASGSGVIISPDGYVVTNHHVAGDAVWLRVTMPNREEVRARLIGSDPMSDIAVIKLTPEKPQTFTYAQWGDSEKLQVGDPVLAMGSPLSLSQSVTQGIVSNRQMTMPSLFWNAQFELAGENVGSIVRWIGHDAQIFPGNSGGPLVNLQGEVIGINEISLGLAGAIPGNLARTVTEQLIKAGEVKRAFLGFLLQPVFRHDKDQEGALISDVVAGSPAAKAEIKPGDRLLKVGALEPRVQFAEDLPPVNLYIYTLPIGQPVDVVVERDGQKIQKTLTAEMREKVEPKEREFKNWAVTGRDLSFWTALELKRPNKNGVLITSVGTGGPSGQAKPALQGGDILVRVNNKPVNNMDELTTVTQNIVKGQKSPVPTLIAFIREGDEVLTVVNVGIEELPPPDHNVRTAWVPVATQVLTQELAKQLNLADKTGVRVTRVYEDHATSDTFGLKVGDIILGLDNEPIPAAEQHDVEVFTTMIRQYKIGTEVTLTVMRDGQQIDLKSKLTGKPPEPREMERYRDIDFGFTVRNVAYLDRQHKRWEDNPEGVLIDSVDEGGWTALGRVGVGDLLMAIDGQPVKTIQDIRQTLAKIKDQKKPSVIFKVRRGIHTLFLEVEPIWKPE